MMRAVLFGKTVEAEKAGGVGRERCVARFSLSAARSGSGGWTLIELVIVMTVLSILTMGIIPLVKTSVRRQREYRLRESLREMREAVKEFKRDAVGVQCSAAATVANQQQQQQQGMIDPRSKVVISDCTIFGVDNPDHYPPDLETLVNGVNVIPRANLNGINFGNVDTTKGQATDNKLLSTKKKVYLRELPVDPITGQKDWCVRSSYDPPDEGCASSPVNVFDVRSRAEGTALNGEKYSDW